jgi:hypothetical protein
LLRKPEFQALAIPPAACSKNIPMPVSLANNAMLRISSSEAGLECCGVKLE